MPCHHALALEDQAIRGVSWTLVTYAATKLLTVATTLVLARILVPGDFGLMALAWLTVGVLQLLREIGLGSALIVRQDFDERAQATVLTLMVALGGVITALLVALSPVAAAAFREPRLQPVLAVLAITIVLSSLGGFYEALQERALLFRQRFISQVALAVATSSVAIALAAAGLGVWSLVAGQIAGTMVYTAVLVALAPRRFRPAFDAAAAREIVRTAWGFGLQGVLDFLQHNADYLAVGRTLGATHLGHYSMAFRLGELPYQAVAEPVSRVTFPAFARMRERGEDVAPSFLAALRMTALVTCPVGVLLSATADPFTRTVLGGAWLPTIGPLAVFGIWAAIRTLQATVVWLLNSVGRPATVATVAAVRLPALAVALFVAAHLGGITAVAWVMLADVALSLLLLTVVAHRGAAVPLGRQWRAVRPVALACAATWVVARWVAVGLAGSPAALALVAATAAGLLVYATCVALLEPALPRATVRDVRRILARRTATTPA
jgi:PST family polysaccharide transporter